MDIAACAETLRYALRQFIQLLAGRRHYMRPLPFMND